MRPPITFVGSGGLPDPTGAYVAVLNQAILYAADDDWQSQLADYLGGTSVLFDTRRGIQPPGASVITGPGWSLIALEGTSNCGQAYNFVTGAFVFTRAVGITSSGLAPCLTNAGFQDGLGPLADQILPLLGTLARQRIMISGYSYGGGCAFILGRQIKQMAPTANVQILTIGEPKTFNNVPVVNEVDYHYRLVAVGLRSNPIPGQILPVVIDVVPLVPPSNGALGLLPGTASLLPGVFGTAWQHFGLQGNLTSTSLLPYNPDALVVQAFAENDLAAILYQSPYSAFLHDIRRTYMPWTQSWAKSRANQLDTDTWAPFVNAFTNSMEAPIPQSIAPAPTVAEINASTYPPTVTPITPENVANVTLVSATAFVTNPTVAAGVSEMPSFFKGTIEFNSVQGGWEESCYAVGAETPGSMQQKMIGLLAKRMLLSYGPDAAGCTNPVIPYAIRVEDELQQRDAFVTYILPNGAQALGSSATTPPSFYTVDPGSARVVGAKS